MKLTRDRLKQIIKEELEEMMQVDEVDGVNPEYDDSNLESIAYSIGSILRGQGSAGVPQSMGAIVNKIDYPPRNVDIPPKFKDGVNRFFKVQKSPDSFLKLNNLPYIESIPGVIRDIAEFFLDVERQKALGLGIDPSEKQQYLKAADSLQSMIKTAGDKIKQGQMMKETDQWPDKTDTEAPKDFAKNTSGKDYDNTPAGREWAKKNAADIAKRRAEMDAEERNKFKKGMQRSGGRLGESRKKHSK